MTSLKGQSCDGLLQLDSTEDGIVLQLLPDDPPSPPDRLLPHQHKRSGDDGAEDIIIFKGQEHPQGYFNIFNWPGSKLS